LRVVLFQIFYERLPRPRQGLPLRLGAQQRILRRGVPLRGSSDLVVVGLQQRRRGAAITPVADVVYALPSSQFKFGLGSFFLARQLVNRTVCLLAFGFVACFTLINSSGQRLVALLLAPNLRKAPRVVDRHMGVHHFADGFAAPADVGHVVVVALLQYF